MTFEEYVIEVFEEHHNCLGMGLDEIQDVVKESTHDQRVEWLERQGYDLIGEYAIM